jgi:acyl-CoA synthetase (NDP forming)
MSHRLDPLLRPRSLALVGASPRPDTYGHRMIGACLDAGFEGEVFLVNPNYDEIEGRPCYRSLMDLPRPVEHTVLMVANARLEQVLAVAIEVGAQAATIFASGYLDDGRTPPLWRRLQGLARAAGVAICGGNGSGFYNREAKVRCQMWGGEPEEPGPVALISQSGSAWAAMVNNDGRLRFNLSVSSGQEITTDVAAYMDYALDMAFTRAIGLFVETARDPEAFIAVLGKAAERDVPVVVVKVARTETSKRFAISHSGAIVGDDSAYDAVFERYGVLRVDDLDELMATLQLLSTGRRPRPGCLVAITDSGGEREQLVDVASGQDVAFAEIEASTRTRLSERLEFGLEPENPLDAWGTGHDYAGIFHDCMAALMGDPAAAAGLWIADLRDRTPYHQGYVEAAERIAAINPRPLAFATCFSGGANSGFAERLRRSDVPLLEGLRPALVAVRRALDYRDFRARPEIRPPALPGAEVISRWQARLAAGHPLDEAEGLGLIADFGVPASQARIAESAEEAVEAARAVGFPVALKTAAPGLSHKSDVGGVHLGLGDEAAVAAAYDALSRRLGPRVVLAPMAEPGVEFAFGLVTDAQFGPLVMIGAGGVLVENLRDTCVAVPPVDVPTARTLVDRLAMSALLHGARGRPASDVNAVCEAFARFSLIAATLVDEIAELDVNPVIAGPNDVTAVDALVVPRAIAGHTVKEKEGAVA